MRGDSLRDLYAKSLALLGLGVLAGAGALVDYWPLQPAYPGAPSVLLPPVAAAPLSVEYASLLLPPVPMAPDAPRLSNVRNVATPLPVAAMEPAQTPLLLLASIPATESSDILLGTPIRLSEPVRQTTMLVSEHTEEELVYLSAAMELQLRPLPPAALSASDSSGDGMITGAFKKTGSSIVKTSVWTGASIVDAMRVVGSVVRRALPD